MASRLARSVSRTVEEADRISAAFARQLARILRELEGEIRRLIKQADTTSRVLTASQALQARQAIKTALERAGYGQLAREATNTALDRMAQRVLTTRKVAGHVVAFPADTQQMLVALKSLHLVDVLEEGEQIVNAVTRAVTRGMLGRANPLDLIEEVARVLHTSEARIATLYDTAVSIYGRQVEAAQAGDDPDTAFLYAGPHDDKTRDFCAARVGKVYSRAAIDAMDNGQIANVLLTGGGYNCRHQFIEVSRFSDLYPLVDTDARAPEFVRPAA